jgi:GT2 family glycosyltransferase/ribosomal protein S27E
MIKYSIIMPYFDRLSQLSHTLVSLRFHYGQRNDFEVLVIVDCKNRDDVVDQIKSYRKLFPQLNVLQESGNHEYWTCCHLYNDGVKQSQGEFIVITCPECFHLTNVLDGLDQTFVTHPNAYVNCACLEVKDFTLAFADSFQSLSYKDGRWLQHSKYHHRMLNYCTAVSKDGYWKIGGFDERLSPGYACGDNDFRDRVALSGLPIINRDDLIVLHQEHKSITAYMTPEKRDELNARNKAIWKAEMAKRGHYTEILKGRMGK